MKKTKTLKWVTLSLTAMIGIASITSIAAACKKENKIREKNDKDKQQTPDNNNSVDANNTKRDTNQMLDVTKYGVKTPFNPATGRTRTLLFPADRNGNKMDANGVFHFKLHLKPVRGVKGEWVAIATEVKSLTDNSLVRDANGMPIVKTAFTTAVDTNNDQDFPLAFAFDGPNALEDKKFYTFLFYALDGSERILYQEDHVKNSADTFPATLPASAKMTNQTLDVTKYGVAKYMGSIKTRTLIHPADTANNKLDAQGVFNFALHLAPVRGVTGEWVAIATEVKGANDNSLVLDNNKMPVVKTTTTTAVPTTNDADFPLRWMFNGDNKLENNKFYTFIFYKKDGSERIVFKPEVIENNTDIFPAKLPN
ncbi:hypothetical protein OF377_01375 [Ureaplasma sp. ES3154-GEN]|uniref:Vmc-like lipoprotein signal peptide domain-containing protein n=1 Tax=Ureaplasma sp. ES3154-GEN TaxID=2984844 RepID=UPI0021E8BB64|nr:hypothetical protein [Ureaplasma sp. ES3154-GEN]MCV3743538.1 hypothetical protein [Ureaplasma sp. ES3154-GEN]